MASSYVYRTEAATPSDTVADPKGLAKKGVLVTVAGNVSLVDGGGNTVALTAVAAGTLIPIQTRRINSTGTTATVRLCY